MIHECQKHKVPLEDVDCPRCRGNGATDSDLDELDNPISWHDGKCHYCKGHGILAAASCPDCEQEQIDEDDF